jgi:RNA polymerase sigma factor (sigma-70 family)
MAEALPPELRALFCTQDQSARDAAWEGFVSLHSRLLLHAARSLGSDYDGAMDRYTSALERLRDRDDQRLRAYRPDGRTKFTTWLVVVFRRLCLDHYRRRYGRASGEERSGPAAHARQVRRRLADGLNGALDPGLLEATNAESPDADLTARHRQERLAAALAALTPADRLLLKFRFEDDLSASQIARTMGLPTPFHVYRRLNAVFVVLRRTLRSAGIDAPDG